MVTKLHCTGPARLLKGTEEQVEGAVIVALLCTVRFHKRAAPCTLHVALHLACTVHVALLGSSFAMTLKSKRQRSRS
jgi:hypothetical protein